MVWSNQSFGFYGDSRSPISPPILNHRIPIIILDSWDLKSIEPTAGVVSTDPQKNRVGRAITRISKKKKWFCFSRQLIDYLIWETILCEKLLSGFKIEWWRNFKARQSSICMASNTSYRLKVPSYAWIDNAPFWLLPKGHGNRK